MYAFDTKFAEIHHWLWIMSCLHARESEVCHTKSYIIALVRIASGKYTMCQNIWGFISLANRGTKQNQGMFVRTGVLISRGEQKCFNGVGPD